MSSHHRQRKRGYYYYLGVLMLLNQPQPCTPLQFQNNHHVVTRIRTKFSSSITSHHSKERLRKVAFRKRKKRQVRPWEEEKSTRLFSVVPDDEVKSAIEYDNIYYATKQPPASRKVTSINGGGDSHLHHKKNNDRNGEKENRVKSTIPAVAAVIAKDDRGIPSSEMTPKTQRTIPAGNRISQENPFLRENNLLDNRIPNVTALAESGTTLGRSLLSSIPSIWNATDTTATKMNDSVTTSTIDSSSASDSTPTPIVSSKRSSLRRLWKRRHARTLEEGIRRETAEELSQLLNRAQLIGARTEQGRRLVERSVMGLINAVTSEVEDLDVEISTVRGTPVWRKAVPEVKINFSRLGFKPIRLGGSNNFSEAGATGGATTTSTAVEETLNMTELSLVESADEAFDRIDKDNSGTLDREEIAEALSLISDLDASKVSLDTLAEQLIDLYDVNSDGVVDREEYQKIVEDMARLRGDEGDDDNRSPLQKVQESAQSLAKGISEKAAQVASSVKSKTNRSEEATGSEREMGSITLADLNLDLRRLLFGTIPIVKKITPGGPLILQPFTVTVKGSFNAEDVMGSFLLDRGLKLLVARVLRVRLRSFRDVTDGAYFVGRRWKLTSKAAPAVQVLDLSKVEFDKNDKMVVTGRARIRSGPNAPVVTNTFKFRTKIGTGKKGQAIRVEEPELAFVFECPAAWENGLELFCKQLGMPTPPKPEPIYSFFPIYSPFQVTDENAGFDMGEDNCLRSIFIKNGKLRVEMTSVLRPGRFLGNHYLAFTIPNRTFIVTLERVREGMRTARRNKKIAMEEKKLRAAAIAAATSNSSTNTEGEEDQGSTIEGPSPRRRAVFSIRRLASAARASVVEPESRLRRGVHKFATIMSINPWNLRTRLFTPKLKQRRKSFFTRFVEGYTLVEREGDMINERLTNDISLWFGRQQKEQGDDNDDDPTPPSSASSYQN